MEKTLQKQVKQILDNIDAKENVYPFEESIKRYKDFINEALTEVSKYKKSTL